MRFTVLEEKFVGRTVCHGYLAALSDGEATIQSPLGVGAVEQPQGHRRRDPAE